MSNLFSLRANHISKRSKDHNQCFGTGSLTYSAPSVLHRKKKMSRNYPQFPCMVFPHQGVSSRRYVAGIACFYAPLLTVPCWIPANLRWCIIPKVTISRWCNLEPFGSCSNLGWGTELRSHNWLLVLSFSILSPLLGCLRWLPG